MTLALAIGATIIGLALVAWSAFRMSGIHSEMERFVADHGVAVELARKNVDINREGLENYKERYPTVEQQEEWARRAEQNRAYESEALDTILRGQQVALSRGVEALLHRLDAIAEALDDKKVRVMNVPTYSAPQNPTPAPQIGPNTSIRSDDPAIRTFFGQIQALGKAKRAEEAELEALRVQVRDERARLEQLATVGTAYGRRSDDQPTQEEPMPSPPWDLARTDGPDGPSDTAFDDVMRRVRAKGEQK